jgi:hypothetical protein
MVVFFSWLKITISLFKGLHSRTKINGLAHIKKTEQQKYSRQMRLKKCIVYPKKNCVLEKQPSNDLKKNLHGRNAVEGKAFSR